MKTKSFKIHNKSEYEKQLGALTADQKEQLLGKVLEIRNFEIEYYWKRASYFWAFIALAFAGYFSTYTIKKVDCSDLFQARFIISCIGIVFSLAWFLASKGSKYWQENWEKHVALIKNDGLGFILKTTLRPNNYSILNPKSPYKYSVSKINHFLCLFVTIIWIVLLLQEIYPLTCRWYFDWANLWIIAIITVLFIILILRCAKTRSDEEEVEFDSFIFEDDPKP